MTFIQVQASQLFRDFGQDYKNSQFRSIIQEIFYHKDCNDRVRRGAIVAGGLLVRSLLGTDIFKGDIDIWADKNVFEGVHSYLNKRYDMSLQKHAYKGDFQMGVRKTSIQLINDKKLTSPLTQVLTQFDFKHCMFAFHIQSESMMTTHDALISLASRKAALHYIKDPAYTLQRAIKYKKLGFDVDDVIGQLAYLVHRKKEDVLFDAAFEKEVLEAKLLSGDIDLSKEHKVEEVGPW